MLLVGPGRSLCMSHTPSSFCVFLARRTRPFRTESSSHPSPCARAECGLWVHNECAHSLSVQWDNMQRLGKCVFCAFCVVCQANALCAVCGVTLCTRCSTVLWQIRVRAVNGRSAPTSGARLAPCIPPRHRLISCSHVALAIMVSAPLFVRTHWRSRRAACLRISHVHFNHHFGGGGGDELGGGSDAALVVSWPSRGGRAGVPGVGVFKVLKIVLLK